jgi:hypothetical protein
MSISFADYNKNRKNQFEKLASQLNKQAGGSKDDERYWKPEVDKTGNGFAVIRFLPPHASEDYAWVQYFDHGFQGPGGWYIEKSLTSLGQKDPVSEYNSQLWNSGLDENKDIARKQKRRLHYVANIYVVSDPARPQNEGKVFLFSFGKKIFDKINDIMTPQFQDEKPIDPFDLIDGASFKLKIRTVEGYRNYDKSEFSDAAPLFDLSDESKYDAVLNAIQPLQPIVAPSEFKSFAELKTRLHRVLGWDQNQFEEHAPKTARAEEMKLVEPKAAKSKNYEDNDVALAEDDDGLDFFKQLAED